MENTLNKTPYFDRVARWLAHPHEVKLGIAHLEDRVMKIRRYARKEGLIAVKEVCGVMCTRTNPETGKLEVFLVKGGSKGFWQFVGGHVLAGESRVDAMQREIEEELDPTEPVAMHKIKYVQSYSPLRKTGSTEKYDVNSEMYDIHAFEYKNCPWDLKKGNIRLGKDGEKYKDANDGIWTSNPLMDGDEPRLLTPQTDYMLRHYLGFTGPKNKFSAPDDYDGDPTK